MSVKVKDGTYLIGRRAESGHVDCLVIDNPSVSARHAELVVLDGSFHLTDLDSRNGTWRVDSKGARRLASGYVEPDERLRFGVVECSLEDLFSGRILTRD